MIKYFVIFTIYSFPYVLFSKEMSVSIALDF